MARGHGPRGGRATLALAIAATLTAAPVHATAPSRVRPAEIDLVRSYHGSFQGLDPRPGPRSGTDGGAAVHVWFAKQLRRLEMKPRTQAFGFPRFAVRAASLAVASPTGTVTPEVFPLYYRGTTPPGGITAPIVDIGSGTGPDIAGKDLAGKIALAHSPVVLHARPVTLEQAYANALRAGAAVLVVAIDGPANYIPAQNAPVQAALGPLPTLLVGNVDGERLRALDGSIAHAVLDASLAAPATTVVAPDAAQPYEGIAYNTYGVIPGRGDDVIVVGTPLNGWFDVATERGSGVAVLLELARRLAEAPLVEGRLAEHTIVFVGTGGHEVEAGGLARFLACYDAGRVVAYVHMGATVGGQAYEEVAGQVLALGMQEPSRSLHLSENPLMHAYAAAAFDTRTGVQILKPAPGGVANPGEQADAYAYGIPIAAISGAGLYFHTEGDVPATLSQEYLAPMSDAYHDLVRSLLGVSAADMHAANGAAAAAAAEPHAFDCPPLVGD